MGVWTFFTMPFIFLILGCLGLKAAAQEYEYLDCYYDFYNARTLKDLRDCSDKSSICAASCSTEAPYCESHFMTIEVCKNICRDKNYKYFGLQAGRQCFCGGIFSTQSSWLRVTNPLELARCSTPCTGNGNQECGGDYIMRVYKFTGPLVNSICYHPGASVAMITGSVNFNTPVRQQPVSDYFFNAGDIIQYACEQRGHRVIGLSDITCQLDSGVGAWTGRPPDGCTCCAAQCSVPPTPANALQSGQYNSTYYEDDTVEFLCINTGATYTIMCKSTGAGIPGAWTDIRNPCEPPLVRVTSVQAQNESTLTVSWQVTLAGNLLLDVCTIEYQQEDDAGQPVGDWRVSTNKAVWEYLMYDVTGLTPYTFYAVRLTCNNSVGVSNTETAEAVKTRQFFPGHPRMVEVANIRQTSVRVQWFEPLIKNGPIAVYRVELESKNDNKQQDTTNRITTIPDLMPGTNYSVYVRAMNREDGGEVFLGEPSNFTSFKTLPDVIDNCIPQPCQNAGICTNRLNTSDCTCVNGFTGETCETVPPDPCVIYQPCRNDAPCMSTGNQFTCQCQLGYTGQNCDTEIDWCTIIPKPCNDNGICSNDINSFVCACVNGFTGSRCQIVPPTTPPPGCRHPGNLENGRVLPDKPTDVLYPPGKKVEFLCLDGYMLEGEGVSYCQLDSTWSHERPVCVETRTGVSLSSTGFISGLISLVILVMLCVLICSVVIFCRKHKRLREKDPNIQTDCEIAPVEKDNSLHDYYPQFDKTKSFSKYNDDRSPFMDPDIRALQHDSSEDINPSRPTIENKSTTANAEVYHETQGVKQIRMTNTNIPKEPRTHGYIESENNTNSGGKLLLSKCEVVPVKNEEKPRGLSCKEDIDSETSQEYDTHANEPTIQMYEIPERSNEQRKSLKEQFGVLMEPLRPKRKGKKRKYERNANNKKVSTGLTLLFSMRPKQSNDDPTSSVKKEDRALDSSEVENDSIIQRESAVLDHDVNVDEESLTVPMDVDETFEQGVQQKSTFLGPRYISTAAEHIGVEGGIVHLPDVDVSLKIPADALPPEDIVNISLTVDTQEVHPTIQEDQLIFGQVITCKPDGLTFLKPVNISVPHSGVNISELCLQVWCKSDGEEAIWEKIYDGSQDHTDNTVRVLVEGNRIKLRVGHFTAFSFITVPICNLWNWLKPPEQLLEILAFLDPANVAAFRHVCLRVYAVQTTDVASKKRIEQYEEKKGNSGMCSVPSGFILKANGKNLSVVVKNIAPKQKWLPNGSLKKCITYKHMQNGGQEHGFPTARCEIMFLLCDNVDQADSFVASFDLSQEENAENDVEGICVTDTKARTNRINYAEKDPPRDQNILQQENELPIHDRLYCQAPAMEPLPYLIPKVQPDISDRSVRRKCNRAEHVPHEIAVRRSAVELDKRTLEQPIISSYNEIHDIQPVSDIPTGFGTSDGSVRRKRHRVPENTVTHKAFNTSSSTQSMQANHRGKSAHCNTSPSTIVKHDQQKYLNEDDLRSFIVPVSITVDQNTAASSQPKRLNGDCGPFLKTMARKIESRWKNVAKILDFTLEECKDFERKSTINETWWPAYKMLLEWKKKLPEEEHGQFYQMLAEAIQTFE